MPSPAHEQPLVFKPLNLTPHALHCTHKQQRTLGQLSRARMALVAVCRSCKHRRVLYMPRLIERFGEHYPAINLRRWLRCTSCRARAPNLHQSAR
jgi:hypothetical protein